MTGRIETRRLPGSPVAELVFDNATHGNAISAAMITAFCDALEGLERDDTVKVIVIAGQGADLTVGSDLTEIAGRFPPAVDGVKRKPVSQRARFNAASLWWGPRGLYRRVLQCSKITILAAQGRCLEAGLYLTAYCDLTIASDTAIFGNPHWQHLGANGDLSMLVAAVGLKRVKELLYAGAQWNAREAAAFGLVDGVVPPSEHAATIAQLAATCAMIMRDAVAAEKQITLAALARMQIDTGLAAAAVLGGWSTNIHFRQGEFNFLREAKRSGMDNALDASETYFNSPG